MNLCLAAALLSVSAVAAVAGPLPEAVAESGTLRIANTPNYPPLEFKDPATNTLTGFDIDLGTALAETLGVTPSWQETSFSAMLSALQTDRVDMIMSGMSDLPDRHDSATFVDYLRSGPQFFVRAEDAAGFASVADVCGKKVGASRRTSYPAEIEKWSAENCADTPVTFIGTDGSADARTQLRQGRIDVAVQGNETLPYVMDQEPDTYSIVGEPFTYQLIGMALPKDQTEFHEAVVTALEGLMEDGTYGDLLEKWNLTGSGVETVTINGAE
ncbi:ABC transporter substrate-binding protein [Falsirhodobacter halotolerans]|uniref:ABC transporter substrate-binding protein n=1 Tax=Falsirhodobacter halotolerans TaxID=1146892 RepID=UPI001FD6067E|nr:ABC transporter substrate-binding protein [Falsirhodobacter halotolerans]MCJ8140852.1 ABC transporter substrate-binding protein [Falsirhodobacter halotolerans]